MGTRVTLRVVSDQKTGRPRAEDVRPPTGGDQDNSELKLILNAANAAIEATTVAPGELVGTMNRTNGNFGFIRQDDGSDMFLIPGCCSGFDGKLPPIGTRVKFTTTVCPRNGLLRAEGVVSVTQPVSQEAVALAESLPNLSTQDLLQLLGTVASGGGLGGVGSGGHSPAAAAPAVSGYEP